MAAIRIANAPCSWGILEFDLDRSASDFRNVLDEIRQSGYDGTELGDWGFMPTEPQALREVLAERDLEMLAAFVPVALADRSAHATGIETATKTARLIAAVADQPFLVLADDNGTVETRVRNAGRVTPEMGLSDEQWAIFAEGAERVARTVFDETGVRTVFHHHCAGYVETPEEIDTFLDRTEPDLVGLCFDTGHYAFGGGDPTDGLRRHADRVRYVHFKDHSAKISAAAFAENCDYFEAVRRGVFCELGAGDVDFQEIIRQLREIDYDHWIVVEQDVLPGMGSPLESACRNREFLRQHRL